MIDLQGLVCNGDLLFGRFAAWAADYSANPWFMGALLVSMGLTMAGISLSAVPQAMVNAAQLVIGVNLGGVFVRISCIQRRAGSCRWRWAHWCG